MNVLWCAGDAQSSAESALSACVKLAGTALVLRLDPETSLSAVTYGVISLLGELRSLQESDDNKATGGRHPVTVLCIGARGASPAAEALYEAARGIVQSITLEPAACRLRCNVLRVERISDGRIPVILRYLASADGGFAIGSTLDLTSAR